MEQASPSAQQPASLTAQERTKIRVAVPGTIDDIQANRNFKLPVCVNNGSTAAISSDPSPAVYLSYHWANTDGEYAVYDGLRSALASEIAPGQKLDTTMSIKPPADAGVYELQIGLIQKQVSWFEVDNPAHLQKLEVQVAAAKPAAGGKLLAHYAQDRPVEVETPPAIFSFELTNQCPFKCIMCARTNNMTRAEGNMSFATFKKAIDEFVAVNPEHARTQDVWLHGFGESLVHPEFARFMRYATDNGVNAGLSINPLMLTKKVASDLLDSNPRHLYVALDGHDDETFEQIRGVKNAYHKSKRRLLAFLKEKKRRGVDTKISLSMIDFPNNQGSIHEVADFWASCEGIDDFVAKPFVSWDGKAEDVNLLMGESAKKPPVVEKVRCDFPWTKMTVSWDGDLVPCCFDYNKRYSLGNINEHSLVEIWNGEKMQALRSEFIANKVTNPLCNGCEYLYQEIVAEP
jgi:radical SAM protein with 4Fe4S-binding SPASM domain